MFLCENLRLSSTQVRKYFVLNNAFWKLHMHEYADYWLRRISLHLASNIININIYSLNYRGFVAYINPSIRNILVLKVHHFPPTPYPAYRTPRFPPYLLLFRSLTFQSLIFRFLIVFRFSSCV